MINTGIIEKLTKAIDSYTVKPLMSAYLNASRSVTHLIGDATIPGTPAAESGKDYTAWKDKKDDEAFQSYFSWRYNQAEEADKERMLTNKRIDSNIRTYSSKIYNAFAQWAYPQEEEDED